MVIIRAKVLIINRKNKPPPFRNPLTNKQKLNFKLPRRESLSSAVGYITKKALENSKAFVGAEGVEPPTLCL